MRYEMMSDTPSPQETKELESTVEILEPGVSLEHFRFERTQDASEPEQEQIQEKTGTAFDSRESSRDGFERESDIAKQPEYLDRKIRDWLDTGDGIWEKHTGGLLNDLGLETQLGLPYLEKKNGELHIPFRPHKEVDTGDGIAVYEQRYALECRYPSEKIVRFEMFQQKSFDEAARIDVAAINSEGKYLLEDLRQAFFRIRDICREDGNAPDVSVKKYQRLYWETVDALGLSEIYGRPDD